MGFISDMFSENGKVSNMRFNSTMVIITACVIAVRITWNLADGKDISENVLFLVLGFLTTAFGAKVLQKGKEKVPEIKPEETKTEDPK